MGPDVMLWTGLALVVAVAVSAWIYWVWTFWTEKFYQGIAILVFLAGAALLTVGGCWKAVQMDQMRQAARQAQPRTVAEESAP